MSLNKTIMALLFSLLLAAAPLFAAISNSRGACVPAGSCPCENCDCCIDCSPDSAPAPVAVPAAANPQVVEWLALSAILPKWIAEPGEAPNPPSARSPRSQPSFPLPLFRRYCALLI